MGPYIVCLVTIDDPGKATRIARHLVEKGLVACVNIVPELRSVYRWKGEVCDEAERLMIMKTRQELFADVQKAVKALHPYEVPEIIALKIDDGWPDYLRWIDEVTQQAP
jgi:periplasmic divalent cation tolerance protein